MSTKILITKADEAVAKVIGTAVLNFGILILVMCIVQAIVNGIDR